jgi:5-methylcytosine-specific restriction endonuclease McrA
METKVRLLGRRGCSVTRLQLQELLENQEYSCAITGVPLTPDNCSVDHVRPLEKGGKNTLENLQLTTKHANFAKRNLEIEEFLEICRLSLEHAGYRVSGKKKTGA